MLRLISPVNLFIAIALAAGVAYVVTLQPGQAGSDATPAARTMTITGLGVASGEPDVGTINLGVQSEAKTATEALANNNARMSKLLATLKAAGIEDRHIQTSNFNVSPRYGKYNSNSQSAPLVGYSVTNQVHVIVKDLTTFGEILDAVVKDGANRIHGISFDFSNPRPLINEARVGAVIDALQKAELYAGASSVKLGKILSFQEQYGGTPRPVQARAMAESMKSVPIAVGESELSASVTITFELE